MIGAGAVVLPKIVIGENSIIAVGAVVTKKDELLLLHYKCFGSQYPVERNCFLAGGLGGVDRANGWGHRYNWGEKEYSEEWQFFESRAVDPAQPGSAAWKKSREPRWRRLQPHPWWQFWGQ